MHAIEFMPPPLSALSDTESDLRLAYLRVGSHSRVFRERFQLELELAETRQRLEQSERQLGELVRKSARFLELVLVSVCSSEACEDLGVASKEDFRHHIHTIARRVRGVSGLDPFKVMDESRDLAKRLAGRTASDEIDVSEVATKDAAVRAVKALLVACPVTNLEQDSKSLGLEDWGHRTRLAYDGLRAFVRRQNSLGDAELERLKTVGALYAQGQLTLVKAATLLDLSPSDAISVLESHGYERALDQITLGTEERTEMLAAVRAARLSRRDDAPSAASESHIARDVIASERIEGVDARRWIQQKS